MLKPTVSQRQAIKKFLEDGYSLTALEALSLFGAYRLAAHIEVLRNKHNMPILTKMHTDVTGRTYARYSLYGTAAEFRDGIHTRPWANPSVQKEFAYHA